MSKAAFERAFDLVLKHEGGYINDPRDPGGKTKFGISDRRDGVTDGLADLNGDGTGDIKIEEVTKEQAAQIYRLDYWESCRCDKLHPALAIALFDTAVNCGTAQAIRFLQRALRVADDGIIGSITLAAANKADTAYLVTSLLAERQAHYAALSTWKIYGRGWTRRVLDVAHQSLMLTTE